MRRLNSLFLLLSLGVVFGCGQSPSGDESDDLGKYIRANYTKQEVRLPMRDGVTLFAAVYTPADASPENLYPILMIRTPYSSGPYGEDEFPDSIGPSKEFAKERYIFVKTDVRGRFMSEGEFDNMRPILEDKTGDQTDETTDTWDTVEWLVNNVANNNGNVGIWGNSYPGFYTASATVDTHPAIKAAQPSAPIADWFFDDMHHHGAFSLNLTFNFFSSFGVAREGLVSEWPERFDHGTPDAYRFFQDLGPLSNVNEKYFHSEISFWNDITAHPDYDDFWAARNTLPHLKNVSCAVLVVGGLFDAEDLYGIFHTYEAIEKLNPGIENNFVIGPWRHGAWLRSDGRSLGDVDFGFETAVDFRKRVLLPFFAHHLKGEPAPELAEAMVFETGANRWRYFDSWVPEGAEEAFLYLDDGASLSWQPPTSTGDDFAAFVSDPENPVPYTETITTGWHAEYMVEDQRFASRRPDVLVFRSEPLDEAVTLAGELRAQLWVSTTGSDADWMVKLVDEYPGRLPDYDKESEETDFGHTERLVRSEMFRGRYREGYDHSVAFKPDTPTRVEFPLQGVLHTFEKGHRIVIQIQSSLFPFFDRNPQTFVPNIFEAEEDDFVAATHRVYHSPGHPSAIRVGVLPAAADEE